MNKFYEITESFGGFMPEDAEKVFAVGRRSGNKKRSFLFINKLIGKHLAGSPNLVKASGFLLASIWSGNEKQEAAYGKYILNGCRREDKPDYCAVAEDEDLLVIGMAETATGLGTGVAAAIGGCCYQATTRNCFKEAEPILSFNEEHSHAVKHSIYSLFDFSNFRKVMIVDDEITTGKSALNLMESIKKHWHMDEYIVLSLLDWRDGSNAEAYEAFGRLHGTKVSSFCLFRGRLTGEDFAYVENTDVRHVSASITPKAMTSVWECIGLKEPPEIYTGEFGVCHDALNIIERATYELGYFILEQIYRKLHGLPKKLVVAGICENIYIPSRIADTFELFGIEVMFKTATISPVYVDGEIIQSAASFLYGDKTCYFYNIEEDVPLIFLVNEPFMLPRLAKRTYAYYY